MQVDLEIAGGSLQAARLEQALRNAEFEPDGARVWRWTLNDPGGVCVTVKFELLADLDDHPAGATVHFAGCERLGAANLRGTGYAARDIVIEELRANDHGTWRNAQVNVAGLAGFLYAKLAAAHGRHKPKNYYDIAFVLLHDDNGDAHAAAQRVLDAFGQPTGAVRTQLLDLQANFAQSSAQGTTAYVEQFTVDHPDVDPVAAADAQLAVAAFTEDLLADGFGRRS